MNARSRWLRHLLLPVPRERLWNLIVCVPLLAITAALTAWCFSIAAGLSEPGTVEAALIPTAVVGALLAFLANEHWNIRRIVARQGQRREPRWPVVPWLTITLVPLIAGVATKAVRGEDLGTRLRRECGSIIREGTGQSYSPDRQERLIRECIDRRGLNAR